MESADHYSSALAACATLQAVMAFVEMARHRIEDKQAGALPLSISPASATLQPFSRVPLTIEYAPRVPNRPQPFAA